MIQLIPIYLFITLIYTTIAEVSKNVCMTESLLIGFKNDLTVILDTGNYCITKDECLEKFCEIAQYPNVAWVGFDSNWQD